MSLVAYGSSDDSEDDREDSDVPAPISEVPSIPNKQRETVKITIPSLKEFKDEDAAPETLKKPIFKSGSGLFSILPPPKHSVPSSNQNFMPHILTKKKENKAKPSVAKHLGKEQTDHLKKISTVDLDPVGDSNDDNYSSSNQDNSSSLVMDYFSLDTSNTNSKTEVPEFHSNSALFKSLPEPAQSTDFYSVLPDHNQSSSFEATSNETSQNINNFTQQSWDENYHSVENQADAQPSFLNDEGFKRLAGRRGVEAINIIDVNAEDQLTGKDQWLMRSLTEERPERPSKRRHDAPTQQQKRKHQITYLAFQAKERELDLKNQWSMNSRTRRETQAKYGF